jgi:myo-inositol-1(or 4)-monophosphatase
VREAGGFVSPIDPDGSMIDDGEIIASNEAIYDKFSALVRDE